MVEGTEGFSFSVFSALSESVVSKRRELWGITDRESNEICRSLKELE